MPLLQTFTGHSSRRAVISYQKRVLLSAAKNSRILFGAKKTSARYTTLSAGLALFFSLTGCHSAYVNATVSNHTASPISVVQVEYPSASFGIQTIAPGADFHYRFKVLGSRAMKITYTDAAEHEQKSTGPTLNEGTEGALTITVAPDGVHWQSPPAAR